MCVRVCVCVCVCVCDRTVSTAIRAIMSAPCFHHLIKHPNGHHSYLSEGETNERDAAAKQKVRMTFSRKNGVCYYVTGFQKRASLCTCAYIYHYMHTHANTMKASWFPAPPPSPLPHPAPVPLFRVRKNPPAVFKYVDIKYLFIWKWGHTHTHISK